MFLPVTFYIKNVMTGSTVLILHNHREQYTHVFNIVMRHNNKRKPDGRAENPLVMVPWKLAGGYSVVDCSAFHHLER